MEAIKVSSYFTLIFSGVHVPLNQVQEEAEGADADKD
jgi:hypothetical protein